MVGVLFAGVFLAVLSAYVCTEYLLVAFDARRRVLVGEGFPLLILLGSNLLSFIVIWGSAMVLVFASGSGLYFGTTLVCAVAQVVWFAQHLWFYYRNYLRLRYEN